MQLFWMFTLIAIANHSIALFLGMKQIIVCMAMWAKSLGPQNPSGPLGRANGAGGMLQDGVQIMPGNCDRETQAFVGSGILVCRLLQM